MSTHDYAYRVGRVGFDWKGQRLVLGDVLRGADAIELEQPENEHLMQRCARVQDSFFAHHDTPDDEPAPEAKPALAASSPAPTPTPSLAAAADAKE